MFWIFFYFKKLINFLNKSGQIITFHVSCCEIKLHVFLIFENWDFFIHLKINEYLFRALTCYHCLVLGDLKLRFKLQPLMFCENERNCLLRTFSWSSFWKMKYFNLNIPQMSEMLLLVSGEVSTILMSKRLHHGNF